MTRLCALWVFVGLSLGGTVSMYGCSTTTPVDFDYPEVPDDYPGHASWREDIPPSHLAPHELMNLVMVKRWNEGDHDFVGGTISDENGKVHLTYRDVAYVTWEEGEKPDGTRYRYISSMTSGIMDDAIIEQIENGETPPGIKIIDEDSAGIDPYEFLGIENPNKD